MIVAEGVVIHPSDNIDWYSAPFVIVSPMSKGHGPPIVAREPMRVRSTHLHRKMMGDDVHSFSQIESMGGEALYAAV